MTITDKRDPRTLTIKNTLPTPWTPPFPKNQQAKPPHSCVVGRLPAHENRLRLYQVNATSNPQAAAEQAGKIYRAVTTKFGHPSRSRHLRFRNRASHGREGRGSEPRTGQLALRGPDFDRRAESSQRLALLVVG